MICADPIFVVHIYFHIYRNYIELFYIVRLYLLYVRIMTCSNLPYRSHPE